MTPLRRDLTEALTHQAQTMPTTVVSKRIKPRVTKTPRKELGRAAAATGLLLGGGRSSKSSSSAGSRGAHRGRGRVDAVFLVIIGVFLGGGTGRDGLRAGGRPWRRRGRCRSRRHRGRGERRPRWRRRGRPGRVRRFRRRGHGSRGGGNGSRRRGRLSDELGLTAGALDELTDQAILHAQLALTFDAGNDDRHGDSTRSGGTLQLHQERQKDPDAPPLARRGPRVFIEPDSPRQRPSNKGVRPPAFKGSDPFLGRPLVRDSEPPS